MLRVTQIKMPVSHSGDELFSALAARLRVSADSIRSWYIERKAIDARRKPDLYFVYTLIAELDREDLYLKKRLPAGISIYSPVQYVFPYRALDTISARPVIIGSGPAGLFCAWMLAHHGFRPIVLERGDDVETRTRKTERFWSEGTLDPESNVQFGEGGAGTFSDGKLYTGVKDRSGRNREVLRIFAGAGAPGSILYDAHAHLGTDSLKVIVRRIREQIEETGGTVLFRSCVSDILIKNGRIYGVKTTDGRIFYSSCVILAVGHSARDTFRMLKEKTIVMEAKPFAVGVRVQHEQELITRAQYGTDAPGICGEASYKLHTHTAAGQAVYSFCMCPGGYVINASSEEGRLAVNGMSEQARDSGAANSAVVTAVTPEDCLRFSTEADSDDPVFAGIRFQQELERRAFHAGGGAIPAQRLEDYRRNRTGTSGSLRPRTRGAVSCGNVRSILPEQAADAIEEGMGIFGRQIAGYDDPDTLFYGIESRTSSPVRILRGPDLQSSIPGLFPCGEGAGYAGGITSAAIDGLRAAEAAASVLSR